MNIPIFLLSFANDSSDPLPNLEKEFELIVNHVNQAANQQQIQIHTNPFATIDNISTYLTQNNNRVSVFHYGGHANSEKLFFRDGAAFGSGLANQLSKQESLHLVFLNGCSTVEQVRLLLTLGIPSVIATSVDIDDDLAMKFAARFYEVIAQHKTIREAFETAADLVETKRGEEKRPRIYRGLGRKKRQEESLAWGLYTLEEEILEERLIPEIIKNDGTTEQNVLKNANVKTKKNFHLGSTNKPKDAPILNKENVIEGGTFEVDGDFRVGNDYQ